MTKASEIKTQLDKSMTEFENVMSSLKDKDLDVQINPGENGWTVIEILRHIQNSENGMTNNLKSIIQGGDGVPLDFDLMKYNSSANEKMKSVTLDDITKNMMTYRENTLNLLKTVKDEDWGKEGRHPSQDLFTVEKIFEIIWSHPIDHLKGIKGKFGI